MADKFEVLDKFRPYLYNLLNQHPKNRKSVGSSIFSNIWRKILLSLLIFATWIYFVSDGWFCLKQKSDLKIVAQPFSLLLGGFAMKLIYISIVLNGDRVIAIIDFLQTIVEKRKIFFSRKGISVPFKNLLHEIQLLILCIFALFFCFKIFFEIHFLSCVAYSHIQY